MKEKVLFGAAGMPGAGKATIKSIAEGMGYPVVVMGDIIRDETKRRGLPPTPENVGRIMLLLREEEGSTTVARRCLPKIENSASDLVFIDGVRSLDEVEEFKRQSQSFIIVAVHSSPEARFQRVSKRKRSDDPNGWDLFCQRDLRELSVGQGDVISMADYMIVNEGSYEEFKTNVGQVLEAAIRKWKK